MEEYIASSCPESAEILEGLGRTLAWETIRLSEEYATRQSTVRSPEQWVKAACAMLDASVYTTTPTRRTLGALPISYRHLSRHFSTRLGQSPKQYQMQSKLLEAKRLLTETDLPITTIAMELGFASSQHFATQFKAAHHMSPTACRTSSIATH